jgi:hypothetical protein
MATRFWGRGAQSSVADEPDYVGAFFPESDCLKQLRGKLPANSSFPLLCAMGCFTCVSFATEVEFLCSSVSRYGHLTPEQSQVVHKEVAALCADVRPHTLGLVQSFGIPQHLLGPIAFDWIQYNAYQAPGTEAAIQQAQAVFEVVQ